MALFTNFPIALAPGMGINAFFTFTICLACTCPGGRPWHGLRQRPGLSRSLPFRPAPENHRRDSGQPAHCHHLWRRLFIAFIGLKNGGVIVGNPATLVGPGDFTAAPTKLCLVGIILTALLVARRIPGAIVLGILLITLAGLVTTDGAGGRVTDLRGGLFALPHSPAPVFLKLSFGFLTRWDLFLAALPLILTLLLVDMFDNIGTLIGVTRRRGWSIAMATCPTRAGRFWPIPWPRFCPLCPALPPW